MSHTDQQILTAQPTSPVTQSGSKAPPPTSLGGGVSADREHRYEQSQAGSWNVAAGYSGPYKGFSAQIDLYAYATVDNAICSHHLGLPLEAGRALYAALRAVLYPVDEPVPYSITEQGKQFLEEGPSLGRWP